MVKTFANTKKADDIYYILFQVIRNNVGEAGTMKFSSMVFAQCPSQFQGGLRAYFFV